MKRQRGFSRTFWLGLISLIGLLALAGVWLSEGLLAGEQMPVRYLRLEKPTVRVNRENLKAALAPWAGSSFFSVDLDAVRQAVEALPWVASVQVRKAWPDTLWLNIEEHVPVARWGTHALVDQHGDLFDLPPGYVPGDLPWLHADPDAREEVIETFAWLRDALRMQGLTLAELERNRLGAWRLALGNGVQVVLGRKHMRARMQRFLRVWARQGPDWQQQLVRADLRYPNGMAVEKAGSEVLAQKEVNNGQG